MHGESQVFDPDSFAWTDQQWLGIAKRDLVIYELHVGAFTAAGTFRAAIERLHELVELGITAIEIMPVAQSPGRWNWGYDGVGLFAVRNTYGAPDDFKAFVDACHEQGIAVLLDVVYNHLGPEGNYLGDFGPYFSRKHRTPWGEAFNYDGRHAPRVRRFVIENALRRLDEYHLDGLRLDAAHFMFDDSDPHILGQLRDEVARFAGQKGRTLHLMAETNVYDHRLLATGDTGRSGFDAIWCDCLMHAVYSHGVPDVRLTSRKYAGAPDIAEALERGFLYTGPVMTRRDRLTGRRRKEPWPAIHRVVGDRIADTRQRRQSPARQAIAPTHVVGISTSGSCLDAALPQHSLAIHGGGIRLRVRLSIFCRL